MCGRRLVIHAGSGIRPTAVDMGFRNYVDLSSWSSPVDAYRRVRLVSSVKKHTVVSRFKLNTLYSLARAIERDHVPGAIVECGVYRGGSAALLSAATSASRPVVLFDSFKGLPPPGERDGNQARRVYREGWCEGSVSDVTELLARHGIASGRVQFVEGWFQDTLPQNRPDQIALLHIDADWYDSVRVCLENLYDLVSPGGYVVWDDYRRWVGCTRAVDEFLDARGLRGALVRGHYLQKPASV
jgi:O-methyltransferase